MEKYQMGGDDLPQVDFSNYVNESPYIPTVEYGNTNAGTSIYDRVSPDVFTTQQEVNRRRAANQDFGDWLLKSTWNTGVEATLGTLKAISDMPDIIGKYMFDSDNSAIAMANKTFQNDISKWLGKQTDAWKAETYSTYDNQGGWYNEFMDSLVKGIGDGSIGSAVSSLLPGLAVAKGTSLLSKTLSSPLLDLAVQASKNANKIDSLKAIDAGIDVTKGFSKFDNVAGVITGALYSNMWESVGAMTQVLPELKAKMQGKTNPKTGRPFTEQEINEVLKKEADGIYWNNIVNVIPEALGIHSIIKPRAGLLGKGTRDYSKKTFLDNPYLAEAGTEYFQEIQNTYAEESAKRNVDIALGLKSKEYTWVENLFNPKAQASGILGALGAGVSVKAGNIISPESDTTRKLKEEQKKDFDELAKFKKDLDSKFIKGEQILTIAEKTGNTALLNKAQNILSANRAVQAMANGTFDTYLDILDKSIQIAEHTLNTSTDSTKQNRLSELATQLKDIDINNVEALSEDVKPLVEEYNTLKQDIEATPKPEESKITVEGLKKLKEDALKLESHYIKASDKYGLTGVRAFEFAILSSELADIDKSIENTKTFKEGLITQNDSGLLEVNRNKDIQKVINEKEKAIKSLEDKLYDDLISKTFNRLSKALGYDYGSDNTDLLGLKTELASLRLEKDREALKKKKKEYTDKVDKLKNKRKSWWSLQSPQEIEYYYNQELARLNSRLDSNQLSLLDKADLINATKSIERNNVYKKLQAILTNSKPNEEEKVVQQFYDDVALELNVQQLTPLIEEININEIDNSIINTIEDLQKTITSKNITPNTKPVLANLIKTFDEGNKTRILNDVDSILAPEGLSYTINELSELLESGEIFNFIYDYNQINELQRLVNEYTESEQVIANLYKYLNEYESPDISTRTENEIANDILKTRFDNIIDFVNKLTDNFTDIASLNKYKGLIEDIETIYAKQTKYTLKKLNITKAKETINQAIQKAKEILQAQEKNEIERFENFPQKLGLQSYEDFTKPIDIPEGEVNEIAEKVSEIMGSLGSKQTGSLTQQIFGSLLTRTILTNYNPDGLYELVSKFEVTDRLIESVSRINDKQAQEQKDKLLLILKDIQEYQDAIKKLDLAMFHNPEIFKKVLEIEREVYKPDLLPFPEQILAIRFILSQLNTPAPIYLQGLAGTGKSSVVIKYVVDIFNRLYPDTVVMAFAKGEKANGLITEILGNKVEENILQDANLDLLRQRLLSIPKGKKALIIIDEAPKLELQQVNSLKSILDEVNTLRGEDNPIQVLLSGDPNQLGGGQSAISNTVLTNELSVIIAPHLVSQKRSGDANILTFQEEFIADRNANVIGKTFTQNYEESDNINIAGVKGFSNPSDMVKEIKAKLELNPNANIVLLTDTPDSYDIPAMTVEESQGLEFDEVYIDLSYDTQSPWYSNKKWYVASSRAKKYLGVYNPNLSEEFTNKGAIPYTAVEKDNTRFDNNRKWYSEYFKQQVSIKTEIPILTKLDDEEDLGDEPINIILNPSQNLPSEPITIGNQTPNGIYARTEGIRLTNLKAGDSVYTVARSDGKRVYIASNEGLYYEVGLDNGSIEGLPVYNKNELQNGVKINTTQLNTLPVFIVKETNPLTYEFGEDRPIDNTFIEGIKERFSRLWNTKDINTEIIIAKFKEVQDNSNLILGASYIKVTSSAGREQYIPLKGKVLDETNSDYKLLQDEFNKIFDIETRLPEDFKWGSIEVWKSFDKGGKITKGELMDGLMQYLETGKIGGDGDKVALIEETAATLEQADIEVLKSFRGKLYKEDVINGLNISKETKPAILIDSAYPAVESGSKTQLIPSKDADRFVKDLISENISIDKYIAEGWTLVERSNSQKDVVLRKVFDISNNVQNKAVLEEGDREYYYHCKVDFQVTEEGISNPRITIFKVDTQYKDIFKRNYDKKKGNVLLDTQSQRNQELLIDENTSIDNFTAIQEAVLNLVNNGVGVNGNNAHKSKHYGQLQWAFANIVKSNDKIYFEQGDTSGYINLREYDNEAKSKKSVSLFNNSGHRTAVITENGKTVQFNKVSPRDIITSFLENNNGVSSVNKGFGLRLPITDENKNNLSNFVTDFKDIKESYLAVEELGAPTPTTSEQKEESDIESKIAEILASNEGKIKKRAALRQLGKDNELVIKALEELSKSSSQYDIEQLKVKEASGTITEEEKTILAELLRQQCE